MIKSTQKHTVCRVEDLPPGARKIITVHGRSIGVFNIDGRFRALRNICPHHGAPLCLGEVTGTMSSSGPHTYDYHAEQYVLRCPWHGYEFDVDTGSTIYDEDGKHLAVRTFEVTVEDHDVVIHI